MKVIEKHNPYAMCLTVDEARRLSLGRAELESVDDVLGAAAEWTARPQQRNITPGQHELRALRGGGHRVRCIRF